HACHRDRAADRTTNGRRGHARAAQGLRSRPLRLMQESAARWLEQSPMSDPGRAAALYDTLPTDMAGPCRALQGLLIPADWTSAYGLSASHFGPEARTTLPLERRLADITQADPRPLAVERPILKRAPGTCRDFALMLCSVLRHRGIPARVRCGFAAYFTE